MMEREVEMKLDGKGEKDQNQERLKLIEESRKKRIKTEIKKRKKEVKTGIKREGGKNQEREREKTSRKREGK